LRFQSESMIFRTARFWIPSTSECYRNDTSGHLLCGAILQSELICNDYYVNVELLVYRDTEVTNDMFIL